MSPPEGSGDIVFPRASVRPSVCPKTNSSNNFDLPYNIQKMKDFLTLGVEMPHSR